MNISKCRSCESKKLKSCLNLGKQVLTGVFPKKKKQKINSGTLKLVYCENCGLLQLSENFNRNEMYGANYGYMSSLNPTMVEHLRSKAHKLQKIMDFNAEDVIIDIGSNDGTFLSFFNKKTTRIGVDPTISKFQKNYQKKIIKIPDFFSSKILKKYKIYKRAKLITSIAMFYDLENPISFAKDIHETLDKDGLWHFEQSYMPSMIKNISYDTICHEHLEYYSLKSAMYILDQADLKIVDIGLNDINGGSFTLTAAKNESKKFNKSKLVDWILKKEDVYGYNNLEAINEFSKKVITHKKLFKDLILNLNDMGKKVIGYGASTKGNVILQYCKINDSHIPFIADVNPYKKNRYTPGTNIKIISEKDLKKKKPDYLLVLPWHFKNYIINKEKNFLNNGGKIIFPLPEIEII